MKTAPFAGTTEKMTEKLEAHSILKKSVSLKINKKQSKGDISAWTCIKEQNVLNTETSIMTGKKEMKG